MCIEEGDMRLDESLIRIGHPPHSDESKKSGLPFPHVLLKVVTILFVFSLFFHFPSLTSVVNYLTLGPQDKEQTIREIQAVLEKYPVGLANVKKEELARAIYEEATRYNQDPKFILALISIESSFQNRSVSQKGAKGLMQIMPHVAKSIAQEMGIEWGGDNNLFNPFLNVKLGVYYLSQLIMDFEDMELALAAYNCGPTYVKGKIEKKQQVSAQFYYKILSAYHNL
jgi:hypothetical protein